MLEKGETGMSSAECFNVGKAMILDMKSSTIKFWNFLKNCIVKRDKKTKIHDETKRRKSRGNHVFMVCIKTK